tara:strand:+ start:42 stop:611 length:570 start_codon:yes stop_codon:yes gene_type:complete
MALTRLGPNTVNLTSAVTGTLPTANGGTGATSFAPGKVLQVQETAKLDGTAVSVTAASFTDVSGLSVSITPSATSSKILCMAFVNGSQNVATAGAMFSLFRDSTEILRGDASGVRQRATGSMNSYTNQYINGNTPVVLDEPSSTSALTYKVAVTADASTNVFINSTSGDVNNQSYIRGASSIVVMEIAG